MKYLKSYKLWMTVLMLPVVFVTCMTVEDIIYPDNPQVDSDIEIQVKLKFVAETDRSSRLAFAILMPKAWDVKNNATLSLTTTALYAPNAVTDEQLTLMPDNELCPTGGEPWIAAFQSRYGMQGNYSPMEWVVYSSSTKFLVHDKDDGTKKDISGTVTIKLKTGSQNMKVNLVYAYCGRDYGFSGEEFPGSGKPQPVGGKVMEVSGASGDVIDFTVPGVVYAVPAVFGYGDIFSVVFREEGGGMPNDLKGAQEVYLLGKVVYNNGQEKSIDATSAKNLMEKIGDGTWQKYIYPKDFFDLPSDADITATYFRLSNKDRSIIVRDIISGDDFLVTGDE